MQEIASAIQVGAKAYLNRQYKTIAIVGVVVLVIISIAFSPLVGLGYLIGAVGDRVRCFNFQDANIQSYNFNTGTNNYIDNKVKSWDGDIVEIQPGFNTLNNTLSSGSAAVLNSTNDQTELYQGKDVQFYKTDGSYAQMTIDEVLEINSSAQNITKIRVKPEVKRVGLSYFNCFSFGNGVESNRIRDDFNRVFITNGVKASTILQEQYKQDDRTSGLIFSGIYNKNTSLNDLNQFIMADKITKELEPTYGSIQKLFNLTLMVILS